MKRVLSSVLLFVMPLLAWAGPSSSGGGPSIVCRGADNKIQTAQLLDLYEADIRFGLTIERSALSAPLQLESAYDRLKKYDWHIAADVEDALTEIVKHIAYLPAGVMMAPGVDLGDSYAALIPDGCQLAYVGYYESDGTLRISKTIYDHLSETDRAAFFMHEALYKVARGMGGAKNSLIAREVNGYLFSTKNDLSVLDGIATQLRWEARFERELQFDKNYYISPAVRVQPEDNISIEVSGNASMVIQGTEFSCLDENGNETLLLGYGQSLVANQPQVLSAKGCRLFKVTVAEAGDPNAHLIIKYGDEVLLNAPLKVSPLGSFWAFSGAIAVYFPHLMHAPDILH